MFNTMKVNPANGDQILDDIRANGYTKALILESREWRFHDMVRWIEEANKLVTDKIVEDGEADGGNVNLRPYIGVFGELSAVDAELVAQAGAVFHEAVGEVDPAMMLNLAGSSCGSTNCCGGSSQVHHETSNSSCQPRTTSSMLDDDPAGGLVAPRCRTEPSTGGYSGGSCATNVRPGDSGSCGCH